MAESQVYDNSGALFRNTKKANDRQPDYRGPITISGKKYELSGWLKTSKAGNSFLSLNIREDNYVRDKEAEPVAAGASTEDIPF